jgi:hypothetical protein
MDMTVTWAEIVTRSIVTSVPDGASHEVKLAAAADAARRFSAHAEVVRGTVRYESTDGSFGGSLA